MVKYIGQQQWSALAHVVSVGLDEVNDFFTVRKDGFTFEHHAQMLLVHLWTFVSSHSCCTTRVKRVGMMVRLKFEVLWTPKDFSQYCRTKAYRDDYSAACSAIPLK
jgi:hypothetical protein